MFPDSVLLALPTQSVAVRLLLGAVLAGILVRLLLRIGLRAPRLRVAASQLPAAVLVLIGVASIGAFRMPSVIRAFDGTLPTFGEGYEGIVDIALPFLLSLWASIVAVRVGWRSWTLYRARREARRAVVATQVSPRVRRVAVSVAERLGIDTPSIGLREGLQGGAAVVGLRRPIVLVDGPLAARLDDEELEGVLAHEFTHIVRRDNLVAFALCLVGDVLFFVPGGSWSRRRLLIERELATDDHAVALTSRPGALASGLLKVVEGAAAPVACAAFMPEGTLVTRIEHLVDTRPAPSRLRLAAETLAVLGTLAACVVAAIAVPRAIADDQPDSGLGLALGTPDASVPAPSALPVLDDGAVFDAYNLTNLTSSSPDLTNRLSRVDGDPDTFRPDRLRACAMGDARCERPAPGPALALHPVDRIEHDGPSWSVAPVLEPSTSIGIRLFFLSRAG